MDGINLLRVAFVVCGLISVLVAWSPLVRHSRFTNIARWLLGTWAGANILFIIFLWVNHIGFPLNLDLMEGAILQHFQHAVSFQPIYPLPTPEYLPLSYNPLYYVLAIPFGWLFGVNLSTLRLVAILGMLGIGLIIYTVVRQKTSSIWWGLIAAGLFAAAYRVMDTYLDNAHSDSWFVFSALLGTYLLDRNRSRMWNLAGVIILIASFWFKQHGALFAIGGLIYLTWREGIVRSALYWVVVVLLGPVLYIFAGPIIFGSFFHYYTWEVPRQWSEVNFSTFRRYLGFIIKSYPVLALSGAFLIGLEFLRNRKPNAWHIQFIFALFSGLMGALDPGSADNVFIAMGTWFIILGTLGLFELAKRVKSIQTYGIHHLALFTIFALLMYNISAVVVSARAQVSYDDLLQFLRNLNGSVYAPSVGQLQSGFKFYPTAHWVALQDAIRGPGRNELNHPNTRKLLAPALEPRGPAYILANYPLETYPWIAFLNESYVLESDLGDRFEPLRVLPKRWDQGWPRYLYRYVPNPVKLPSSVGP